MDAATSRRHTPHTEVHRANAARRRQGDGRAAQAAAGCAEAAGAGRGVLTPFNPGDAVQTPFGKGVVREVRNNHRLLVDVQGRALVVREADVTALEIHRQRAPHGRPDPSRLRQGCGGPPKREARKLAGPGEPSTTIAEIDLHGLTVEDALARAESALNEAMLGDVAALRIIHGRSGGRIRAALHRRLRELPSVRAFRIDPHNEGVTIVTL